MSEVSGIIDELENKISKLLHKMELLRKDNLDISNRLENAELKISDQESELEAWKDKHESLKMANSILGSSESNTAAKLKINTLIREIDHCIAQLSD